MKTRGMMKKKFLRGVLRLFDALFFDPLAVLNKWRGVGYFIRNAIAYKKMHKGSKFGFKLNGLYPVLQDRFVSAGGACGHYFFQDLWAAKEIISRNINSHVDVGSRLDGFVAHLLPFCHVTYIDIRPINAVIDGLEFKPGSITNLPYKDQSVESLSCLHVIEHIGLGRYGDPVDPDGYIKAAKELTRVLAPGGILLLGVPVGRERLCFDAHRVFDPQTIADAFGALTIKSFSLIDDCGDRIYANASFDLARQCDYGCGLYVFEKSQC